MFTWSNKCLMARSWLDPCIEILSEFKLWTEPDIFRFRLEEEPERARACALNPTPGKWNDVSEREFLHKCMYRTFKEGSHKQASLSLVKSRIKSSWITVNLHADCCCYQSPSSYLVYSCLVLFLISAWPSPENLVFLYCTAYLNSEYKPVKIHLKN